MTIKDYYDDERGITQAELDELAGLMDEEIREAVHSDLAPCTPKEFLDEYIRRDPEFGDVPAW
jgi:hypothetical protein